MYYRTNICPLGTASHFYPKGQRAQFYNVVNMNGDIWGEDKSKKALLQSWMYYNPSSLLISASDWPPNHLTQHTIWINFQG